MSDEEFETKSVKRVTGPKRIKHRKIKLKKEKSEVVPAVLEVDVYPNHLIDDMWTFIGKKLSGSGCSDTKKDDCLPFPDYFCFQYGERGVATDLQPGEGKLRIVFTLKSSIRHEDPDSWTFCNKHPVIYARGTKKHVKCKVDDTNKDRRKCIVDVTFPCTWVINGGADELHNYSLLGFILRCKYTDGDTTTIFSSQDPKIGLGGVDA